MAKENERKIYVFIDLSQKMIFRNELIERHHLYLFTFSRGLRDHLKALLLDT